MKHYLLAACVLATVVAAEAQTIKPGDVLVLTQDNVKMYDEPGSGVPVYIMKSDLRSNGDVILFKAARTIGGVEWWEVRITSKATGRYAMPDSVGWIRATALRRSESARPYGNAPEYLQRLRTTIGIARVEQVEGRVVIYFKAGYWSAFEDSQRQLIATVHVRNTFENLPRTTSVTFKDAGTGGVVAVGSAPDEVVIIR